MIVTQGDFAFLPGHVYNAHPSLVRAESATWKLYAKRMMTLARIYGFWKFVTDLDRSETRRYIQMFYGLQFKPLADKIVQR